MIGWPLTIEYKENKQIQYIYIFTLPVCNTKRCHQTHEISSKKTRSKRCVHYWFLYMCCVGNEKCWFYIEFARTVHMIFLQKQTMDFSSISINFFMKKAKKSNYGVKENIKNNTQRHRVELLKRLALHSVIVCTSHFRWDHTIFRTLVIKCEKIQV